MLSAGSYVLISSPPPGPAGAAAADCDGDAGGAIRTPSAWPGGTTRSASDAGPEGRLAQDDLDGRAPAELPAPGVDGGALAGQPVAAERRAPCRHPDGVADPARGEVLHRQGAADAGLARLEVAQQQLAAGLLEVLGHRVGRVHRVDRAELVEADGHLGRHHHVEDGRLAGGDGPHAGTPRARRFSRKAAMPSWPSSLANKRADRSRRSGNRSASGPVRAARSSRLVSASASGAPLPRASTCAATQASTSSAGRTTPTTGLGESQTISSRAGNSLTPWSSASPPAASARSIPEQNTRPVWSSTTTRTESSAIASVRAERSWARIARESALRLAGESRTSVATPRPRSTCRTRSLIDIRRRSRR